MRLLAAISTDIVLQRRNRLYSISIFVSLLTGYITSLFVNPMEYPKTIMPTVILLMVGGSTLLYVVAMIILEKEHGTLRAVTVSPLRAWEYLVAKICSLSLLSSVEALLIWLVVILMSDPNYIEISWSYYWLFWGAGVLALSIMHILVGIVIVCRYDRLMDVMVPMAAVATMMQFPALYFLGAIQNDWLLVIPSAAPTLIIQGSYEWLGDTAWFYAVGYTMLSLLILGVWAHRSFIKYIVENNK